MELTIEQALQQGVAAHKAGKLQDAERLYRAILQSQPLHPDANHNLGVLAVSVNKADAALPLFKTALEANPKIEQFWLSYIDALIKEKQFENAKQVIEQAKKQGLVGEKFDALAEKLTQINQATEFVTPNPKKSLSFSEKRKKLSEKKRKKQNFKSASPPDAELNNLLQQYQNGQCNEAVKLAQPLTERFPKHPLAWKVLSSALRQTGKVLESLAAGQTAVALFPQDVQAHNTLGIALHELGRLEEAEASYTQAIALKPDYAEAYSNLGNTLQGLGRLEEAEASYIRAIKVRPQFVDAHRNLGNTLVQLGKLNEAEASYAQTIALKPDLAEVHASLGSTLYDLGRLDEAETSYNRAIALKPNFGEAKHMLAALTGATTLTAPRDYVEGMFDIYAAKFEGILVDNLGYKIPEAIARIIIADSDLKLLGSITDLGCGTGLFGAEIKKVCKYLEGVDLSANMLAEAMKKNIYNNLIKQDIIDYLSNANLNFNYFVATDVFIYIGDLCDVFRLIKSRNKTGGKLAFSTESSAGDGFSLEQSGRYSHSKKYIEYLSEKFGYKLRYFETQNLRKSKNQYIKGGLYLLEF